MIRGLVRVWKRLTYRDRPYIPHQRRTTEGLETLKNRTEAW